MARNSDALRNVSGTAYWIAHHRANETRRRSPLFRDPWAAELAGDRGAQVQRQLGPLGSFAAWASVARTAILDQRILERIVRDGIDAVLNLGAGLDTRAFRLALPAHLRWFDVDMPEILEHKGRVLKGVEARCQYEAIAADLSVGEVRRRTLDRLAARGSKILVVTEGVLEYLTPEAVRALALELHDLPAYSSWLLSLLAPDTLEHARSLRSRLVRANATVRFTPAEGTSFFSSLGWKEVEWVSIIAEARRLGCMPYWLRPGVALLSFNPALREKYTRELGVACLARAVPAANDGGLTDGLPS